MAGCGTGATRRRLGTLCGERDWSWRRLLSAFRSGELSVETIPPGYEEEIKVGWSAPDVVIKKQLNLEDSEMPILRPVTRADGGIYWTLGPTVGLEVILPPSPADAPAASPAAPPVAPAPRRAMSKAARVLSTGEWAFDTARRLWRERKIPKGVKQSELASLLADRSETAAEAKQLRKPLTAAYLENHLRFWGIWPVSLLSKPKHKPKHKEAQNTL